MSIEPGKAEAKGTGEYGMWLEKLQYLSEAMELTSQPFAAGDPDGTLLIFNEAFCRLTGYRKEELEKVSWSETLTPPESREHENKVLRRLVDTGEPQRYEKEYVRSDGTIVPVEVFTHVAADSAGRTLFYYAFITDITGHRQMDEQLRKANRAYKVLARCNQALIHSGDEAALLEELCRTIVDVGGYRLAWIGYVEDDEARTVRPVARAGHDEGYVDSLGIALNDPVTGNGPTGTSLKTGKPVAIRDVLTDRRMRHWLSAAMERGYRSTLNLPVIHQGQVIGTLVIYSDEPGAFNEEEKELMFELAGNLAYGITAIRDRARLVRAEEELRRSRDGLEARVRERTAELQRSNDRLSVEIEERRRAVEALEIYRLFAENTRDIVVFVRRDGRILEANEAAVRAYGYSREELFSRSIYDLRSGEPGHHVDEQMETAFDRGILFEALHRRKDGTVFPVEVSSQGKYIRGQKVLLSVVRDITERKRAEEALKEAKARAELYVDLMGHDINNMNHAAIGYLELALEALETDKKLRPDDRVLLDKPLQAIRSSSALIDNVRKLQRLMTEGTRTRPIDLHELFREIDPDSLRPNDRDVTIRVGDIPRYRVEANELLRDVFINLITNAIKHSDDEKPLTVGVAIEPAREDGRAYYRCVVEDDGPGIPDELKGKLFHRFQRGKTKAHGKGLGLYLVRALVESYHGYVRVEDRVPGDHTKGTRVVVMLPAAEN